MIRFVVAPDRSVVADLTSRLPGRGIWLSVGADVLQAARADADPRQILTKALSDPASMRTLVNQFGKDPEMLAALRRSVWDIATEGATKGGEIGRAHV